MGLLAFKVIWNIFLAVVPIALAYLIVWIVDSKPRSIVRNALAGFCFIAWSLFLPNACYLLTEWRHFMEIVDSRNLFLRAETDKILFVKLCAFSMFFVLYSGLGMVAFTLAIRPVWRIAKRYGATTWFWAIPFFIAVSLGVYLGLILRYNSWDSATHPALLWRSLVETGSRPRLVGFIVAFGIFLWVAYGALDIWIDGLADRWSRITGRHIHLSPKQDSKSSEGLRQRVD